MTGGQNLGHHTLGFGTTSKGYMLYMTSYMVMPGLTIGVEPYGHIHSMYRVKYKVLQTN